METIQNEEVNDFYERIELAFSQYRREIRLRNS
jgi:hypothetical protein